MTVRIQVLGPLRAWREGDELELGGPQQRAVLGLLAASAAAGSVMSLAELIDALWEERPPASGQNVIQTYLKRLRRVLEPDRAPHAPSRFLHRVGGGHTLHLSDVDLDLVAFRRLVDTAVEAERAGDARRAAGELAEALQLWRGAPLANLALGHHPAVVALDGERWAAVARYGEAMLAIGKAAEALSTLEQAAAACPLDEAAHARLIRAYHAVGNRGRAFEAYQSMRRRLADDLGVDPGPELVAAHLALLQDGPAPEAAGSPSAGSASAGSPGARPATAAESDGAATGADPAAGGGAPAGDPPDPAGTSTRPAQLPMATAAFVGRDEQLRQLDKLRTAQPANHAVTIAAIVGTAGVGKTSLAVHWAHRAAEEYPDGQLFVNLRGFDPTGPAMSAADALRGFLEALHVPSPRIPTGLDAQAGLFRSLLAGRRMLILLDNALDTEQVRPLLPGTPGSLVLVTSRNQLTGLVTEAAQPLHLNLLSRDEARCLLTHRLGAERLAAEPLATDEIVARCGGLPLALAIVAANAAAHPQFPLAALVGELRESGGGLDGFATGEVSTDLRAVFSWSYQALSPGAKRLFRLLAVHPGPDLAMPAAASLAGIAVGQARPLLAALTRAHLLAEPSPGRYALHDLLRAYAAELVHRPDRVPEWQAGLRRLLDHYAHTATAAALLLEPARPQSTPAPAQAGVSPEPLADHVRAREWFDQEQAVVRTTACLALQTGYDQQAWQLAWSISGYLDWGGRWLDNLAVQEVAVEAAVRMADRHLLARAHQNLACVLARLERLDDAVPHFQVALDLFDELGEPLGRAFVHGNLAVMYRHAEQHHDSLRHQQLALELHEAAEYVVGHTRTLSSMAWTYSFLGEFRRAIDYAERALERHTELGDPWGQAVAWDSRGFASHNLGEHAKALDCYRRALALFQEIGERQQEADLLVRLGETRLAIGETAAAATAWHRALTIFEDLNHPEGDKVRAKLQSLAR